MPKNTGNVHFSYEIICTIQKKTVILSHFSNKCVTEMKDSAQNIAKQRVLESERGTFFFGQDFSDIASPEAIRKVLQR